jgi:hypothetical protein
MVIYAVTIGSFAGTTLTRLKNLERKMDKHNNMIERLAKVEASTSSAHHRIDELRGGKR